MELASPEAIHLLMMRAHSVPARGLRRGSAAGGRSGRGRRCQCGECKRCLEEARWDRIFAEKFADPTYYSRPLVQVRSPLTSL